MAKTKTHYLPSLTALRGLAALWVMLFHIDVSLYYREFGALLPHTSTGLITKGYLWVDFFFLLSGFVICHVYRKDFTQPFKLSVLSRYALSRFQRIYPLHIFTLLLLIVFATAVPLFLPHIMDGSWHTYFSWKALISNLLLTNAMNQHTYLSWNIVSWSIGAEWWTYFAGILLLILPRRPTVTKAYIFIIAAIVLLFSLAFWHGKSSLDITFNYGFIRCFLGFAIGINLHRLYSAGIGKTRLHKDSIFTALSLALLAMFHFQAPDIVSIPLFGLIILAAAYNQNRISTFLKASICQYLGKISYSIYMMHGVWYLVFWFFLPIFSSYAEITTFSPPIKAGYSLLFITLSLVSAHYTHKYIEVPGRKALVRSKSNTARGRGI